MIKSYIEKPNKSYMNRILYCAKASTMKRQKILVKLCLNDMEKYRRDDYNRAISTILGNNSIPLKRMLYG